MTRYYWYWVASLATLLVIGGALLLVGVTSAMAKAYAATGFVVVVVGWAPLAVAAVRQPPSVPPPVEEPAE